MNMREKLARMGMGGAIARKGTGDQDDDIDEHDIKAARKRAEAEAAERAIAELVEDIQPSFQPMMTGPPTEREENPVVFMDIFTHGGRKLVTGEVTPARLLGRLHFELRADLVPLACANFMSLIAGARGIGNDGVRYAYQGTKIHRIVRNVLMQGGDLMGQNGACSRSIYADGGTFRDENFILRHTGPGCLSMCNRGFDSNGSLFQVRAMEWSGT